MDQTGLQPAGGVSALADTVAANSAVQDSVEQMITNTIQVRTGKLLENIETLLGDIKIINQFYHFRIAARTKITFLKTNFQQSISL